MMGKKYLSTLTIVFIFIFLIVALSVAKISLNNEPIAAAAVNNQDSLVLHFDNSLAGENNEQPLDSNGITFTQGVKNQGVLVDNNDVLTYSIDNFNINEGELEFYVKDLKFSELQKWHLLFDASKDLDNRFAIFTDNTGKIWFYTKSPVGGNGLIEENVDFSTPKHIKITWGKFGKTLYIDNELVEYTTDSSSLSANLPDRIRIGNNFPGAPGSFQPNAVIDEFILRKKITSISFIECGNKLCEPTETINNCRKDCYDADADEYEDTFYILPLGVVTWGGVRSNVEAINALKTTLNKTDNKGRVKLGFSTAIPYMKAIELERGDIVTIDNDQDSLVLHFDNSLAGENNEQPLDSNGITFTQGVKDQGVLIDNNDILSYSIDNFNINEGEIEFYVKDLKFNDQQKWHILFDASKDLDNRFAIFTNNAGKIWFLTKNGNTGNSLTKENVDFSTPKHIKITWGKFGKSLYIDNELIDYTTDSSSLSANLPDRIRIGHNFPGAPGSFQPNAVIDEFILRKKISESYYEGYNLLKEEAFSSVYEAAKLTNTPFLLDLNGQQWSGNSVLIEFLENNTKNRMKFHNDQIVNVAWEGTVQLHYLSFSKLAEENLYYKKRNLQQAARMVKKWMQERPDLVLGVSIDSEISYPGGNKLADYGYYSILEFQQKLKEEYGPIEAINRKFGTNFNSIGNIDPPRGSKGPTRNRGSWDILFNNSNLFWKEWDEHRRDMMDAHIERVVTWINEVGIPKDRIYTHQIPLFNTNQDIYFGTTLESIKAENGSVGITTYEDSARNANLFNQTYNLDSNNNWGIFEYNPRALTSYDINKRSLNDLFNNKAHIIAPYVWTTRDISGTPNAQYQYRGTEAEKALKDFIYEKNKYCDYAGQKVESDTGKLYDRSNGKNPDGTYRFACYYGRYYTCTLDSGERNYDLTYKNYEKCNVLGSWYCDGDGIGWQRGTGLGDNCGQNHMCNGKGRCISIPRILFTQFDGNTTKFLELLNFENIPIVLEKIKHGKIHFNRINITRDLDFDRFIEILHNKIKINSSMLPELNTTATITVYNITFDNPRIKINGDICPEAICQIVSYENNILVFNVTHFSEFSIEETPAGSSPSNGDSPGGRRKKTEPKEGNNKTEIQQEFIIEPTRKINEKIGKALEQISTYTKDIISKDAPLKKGNNFIYLGLFIVIAVIGYFVLSKKFKDIKK